MTLVRPIKVVLLAGVAAYCVSTIPGVRPQEGFITWLDGWLQGSLYVLTAVLCVLRPLTSPDQRRAWGWISAGLAARALGFILFLGFIRWRAPVPYPSVADFAWLAMPLLVAIGFTGLARDSRRTVTARVVLDGFVGALACAAIGLALLYPTLVDRTADGIATSAVVTNLAYPITDIFLLFVLLGVMTTFAWRTPRSHWLLGGGVAGFAIADGIFLAQVTAGTFRPGDAVSALSLLPTVAIAFAPWVSDGPAEADARPRIPEVVVPTIGAIACVVLLAFAAVEPVPLGAVVIAVACVLLAVSRAVLTVRELERLTAALRVQEHLQRRSETRTHADASRLRAVLDAISEYAIIGGGPATGITFFSSGAERMLGYTSEEVIGKVAVEAFHVDEEIAARARELGVQPPERVFAEDAGRGGRVWTYVRKDGSRLPVEITTMAIASEDGDGPEFVGVIRDVSHEQELARYRATREALVDVLAHAPTTDAALQGAVRIVTEEMGWQMGALWLPDGTSLRCRQLWQHPESASDEIAAGFAGLRMTPDEADGTVGAAWCRGTTQWIEDVRVLERLTEAAAAQRDRLTEGTQTTVLVPMAGARDSEDPIGILQVVGESRARDDAVIELLETIANAIGRHVERARFADELRAARDEAQLASRAKSEFVSRISHELRTPLNAILGFAQLSEHDTTDPRHRERAMQIISAGRHLTDMIDDLLDLAQVERGEMRVSLEHVSATDVVREVLDLMRPLIEARGLELEVDAHEGLHRYVEADFQRLRQVLLNLLSNAVKYNSPDGRIRVDFADVDGERLRFLISDTGPGISERDLQLLFRPFERLGAELGDEQGTGLGLVVSKGLVEAMGGRLDVQTGLGVGTTFVVELRQTGPPAVTTAGAPNGRSHWPDVAWPPATILYIEDNPANVRLVEEIVALQPDARLVTATHGYTGADIAASIVPDVILLDLNLPDIDGWEVLELLRSDGPTSEIPIIIVSAEQSSRQSQRSGQANVVGYLGKPLDVAALVTLVAEVLGRRMSRTSDSGGALHDA